MKSILLLSILLLPAFAQDIPEHPDKLQYKATTFDVPDASKLRAVLENGMVVYAIEDRSLPKVDLSILVRAGSFWEPRGKEGLAGMTGAIMRTGGTATRKPEELDEQLEFLSAQLSVGIGDTQGAAGLSLLSKDLDEGIAILTDVLANPEFRQEKIDLFRAQRLDQLKSRNDSTGAIEAREANLLLYGDYPANFHMTEASLKAITREDLQAYHKRFFHPSNMVMAVSGNFSRSAILEKLEKAFAKWPTPAPEKVTVPPVTHKAKPGVYCFHKQGDNINQGRVTMGHLGIDLANPDAFALRIMNYMFGGGGFTSRLVQVVRTDNGLAYDVRSDYRPGIAFLGTFRMTFQSKSESCLFAAKLCLEEMAKMQTTEVKPEELKAAISFYMEAFPGNFFATPAQTVSTFASAEYNNYPKDFYQTYRDKIAAVTAADVKRVAAQYMKKEQLVYVFVGNMDAIKKGDGQHPAKIEDFGPVLDVPLPDPLSLKRPGQ